MTSLPQVSARECIRALQRAGFFVLRQRGSHIILCRDDPYAQTVVPNHRELGPGLLRTIIRQADLTVEEFVELL
ncbi:MAG: type II toxin-antitoxin system HicA family toxin [Chloroflexi bacterium]|nr:type II toxin-antitoxin system HicA family toxin [Chloroflexota bacterium]